MHYGKERIACSTCKNFRPGPKKCAYDNFDNLCLSILYPTKRKPDPTTGIYKESAKYNYLKNILPRFHATARYDLWEPNWLDKPEIQLEDELFEI